MNQTAAKNRYQNVVCTGACPNMTRADLEGHLRRRGITLSDRINAQTEAVVCADPSGNSGKLKAARAKGLPVVSYGEFLSNL